MFWSKNYVCCYCCKVKPNSSHARKEDCYKLSIFWVDLRVFKNWNQFLAQFYILQICSLRSFAFVCFSRDSHWNFRQLHFHSFTTSLFCSYTWRPSLFCEVLFHSATALLFVRPPTSPQKHFNNFHLLMVAYSTPASDQITLRLCCYPRSSTNFVATILANYFCQLQFQLFVAQIYCFWESNVWLGCHVEPKLLLWFQKHFCIFLNKSCLNYGSTSFASFTVTILYKNW